MLRRRVLDVAVEEINEKTDMQVSYEFEKIGRKITAILFKMDRKATVLDQHDPSTAIRERLKSFGLSEAKITSLLEHHDEGYLWVNIAVVEEQWKKGKVKNVAGYLLQAFADDYSSQQPTLPTREEKLEAEQQVELDQEAEKKRLEQERRVVVEEYIAGLSLEKKEQLREEFLAANTDNLRLQKLQEKNDFEHPAIQAIYLKWVTKTISL